jgi:LacI family transcriptional regulator
MPHTRPRKKKRVALFMGLADTYEHGITRGVVKFAKAHVDWDLFGYGWMFRPFDALEAWQGDGIIARVESAADARRLRGLRCPVVDVAGAYAVPSFWTVVNDDETTGRTAGDYLLSCGFQRFAFCGVEGTGWSEKRARGFLNAVGKTDPASSVFTQSLPWWESVSARGRLARWLLGLSRPVGLFACNDTAGLKVSGLCRELGITVPEEMAIIGVDDEDVLCEMASPSQSSIELDCEEIGFRAAALLNELFVSNNGRFPSRRPVLVAPRGVVERESTRVYTSDDPLVQQAMRFIRLNCSKPLSVNAILKVVPASRRNLESRFKKATGRTLKEEIVRAHLSQARSLLRSTRLTIADVASQSGFTSVQRFYEVFRAAEKMTPGTYRLGKR